MGRNLAIYIDLSVLSMVLWRREVVSLIVTLPRNKWKIKREHFYNGLFRKELDSNLTAASFSPSSRNRNGRQLSALNNKDKTKFLALFSASSKWLLCGSFMVHPHHLRLVWVRFLEVRARKLRLKIFMKGIRSLDLSYHARRYLS